MKSQKTHILMTGGGTLGPVTPLVAIAEEWRRRDPNVSVSWIGTPKGPERSIVEEAGFAFYALTAPKLDRDRKWTWPLIPFAMAYSFARALLLLRNLRPDIIFTAGGYVGIPVILAGLFLGIPSWVHQLDIIPGLANRMMAPFAKRISVTWLESLDRFSEKKTIHAGAVLREGIGRGDRRRAFETHTFIHGKPMLLVVGGGTGARSINEAMTAIGPDLVGRMNIVHVTGAGKMLPELASIAPNYAAMELLGAEIADYYAETEIVVARAGMGTILELAALRKPAILIPLGNTDQLANAEKIEELGAAKILHHMNGQILKQEIVKLLDDKMQQETYKRRIGEMLVKGGEERIVKEAMGMVEEG